MSNSISNFDPRDIPVRLTCWARPATTYRVLQQIKKFKPKLLLVRCDGPKKNVLGNELKVKLVRDIIEREVDWDCQLYTLFHEKNIGQVPPQDMLVYTGKNGDKLSYHDLDAYIALEDDNLPSESFFKFTGELLNKYADNDKIVYISGNNFQYNQKRGDSSYYFSYIPHTWGAATWTSKHNDFVDKEDELREAFDNIIRGKATFPEHIPEKVGEYYIRECNRVYNGDLKNITNDFTRILYTFMYEKLTIIPNKNLVKNIGFCPVDGQNCLDPNSSLIIEKNELDFPLTPPKEVKANLEADLYYYRHVLKLPV